MSPLLLRLLYIQLDFPVMLRLLRFVQSLLFGLSDVLVPECELFMSLITKIVEESGRQMEGERDRQERYGSQGASILAGARRYV